MADFIVGDTKSKIRRQLMDSNTGNPINLTSAIANLRYRINDGGLQIRQMAIVSPEINGVVEYVWIPGDLQSGQMEADIQIILSDGKILTISDALKYVVRDSIN